MSVYGGSESGSAELSSAKQRMQGITGELLTDADFLACCRISQLAACIKQCVKFPVDFLE